MLLFQLDFLQYSTIIDAEIGGITIKGEGYIRLLSFEYDPEGIEKPKTLAYIDYIHDNQRKDCDLIFRDEQFTIIKEVCHRSLYYFIGGICVTQVLSSHYRCTSCCHCQA